MEAIETESMVLEAGTGSAGSRKAAAMNGDHNCQILIADPHPIFRYGLRRLLESETDFHVIGEASDGVELVKLAQQLKPDLVLLEAALRRRSGLEVLCDFANCPLPIPVLLMASTLDKSQVVEAFQCGARGIVLKGSLPEVLLDSIRAVRSGQYWLGTESLAFVVETLREFVPRGNGSDSVKNYGLTSPELAIIGKIVAGFSNKDVGREFSISERTVKLRLTRIFDKLGVSNRVELAVWALNHHLACGNQYITGLA
jgi:two-component system nitrate/nitrite response regulator NarL